MSLQLLLIQLIQFMLNMGSFNVWTRFPGTHSVAVIKISQFGEILQFANRLCFLPWL